MINAPVGTETIGLALTDGSGGTGASLALTSATPIMIQPNITNVLHLTANPVVDHVALALAAAPIVYGGTPADVPLALTVMDADNNIIVGPGNYVDVHGNPITIHLAAVNSPSNTSGSASIVGATSITAPGQTPSSLHYNGNWLDHTTVTVTTTSAAVSTSGATATLSTVPAVVEYALAGNPIAVASGPGGTIWVSLNINPGAVVQLSTTGAVLATYHPGINDAYLTLGPDGNMWVAAFGGTAYRITPAGMLTSYALAGAVQPWEVATGSDGNLWFDDNNGDGIDRCSPTGVSTRFTSGITGSHPKGIALGSDGNIWFAESGSSIIGRITPSGTIAEFSAGISGNPLAMTAGPDGNIWFTDYTANKVGKITPTGAVNEYAIPGTFPAAIVVGPDNQLWYFENGSNKIGSMTTTGVATDYAANITASATYQDQSMTLGPDGNLWFTEYQGSRIAKFVL